jgi:membrane protease YdiL (CAAX protease family)
MLAAAWAVGNGFGFQIFRPPNWHDSGVLSSGILASCLALACIFVLRSIVRATRTTDERRKMIVYSLAPRTVHEWQLKAATVLMASIAEEAAYRGVGFAIVEYVSRSALIAVIVCSLAFAVAHWMQGWKSMLVIFLFAIIMHLLVAYTETLVFAMLVHAIYDCVAIYLIWNEARALNSRQVSG